MKYKPSKNAAEYVRKIMACGHWRDGEQITGNDKALLVHIASGQTVTYPLHDGGNEWNASRNAAKNAGDICGCTFIQPRGRKRSRKRIDFYDDDRQRAEAKRRGDEAERLALVDDLREACKNASVACLKDPSNRKLRHYYDRLRAQLAHALKESA